MASFCIWPGPIQGLGLFERTFGRLIFQWTLMISGNAGVQPIVTYLNCLEYITRMLEVWGLHGVEWRIRLNCGFYGIWVLSCLNTGALYATSRPFSHQLQHFRQRHTLTRIVFLIIALQVLDKGRQVFHFAHAFGIALCKNAFQVKSHHIKKGLCMYSQSKSISRCLLATEPP